MATRKSKAKPSPVSNFILADSSRKATALVGIAGDVLKRGLKIKEIGEEHYGQFYDFGGFSISYNIGNPVDAGGIERHGVIICKRDTKHVLFEATQYYAPHEGTLAWKACNDFTLKHQDTGWIDELIALKYSLIDLGPLVVGDKRYLPTPFTPRARNNWPRM